MLPVASLPVAACRMWPFADRAPRLFRRHCNPGRTQLPNAPARLVARRRRPHSRGRRVRRAPRRNLVRNFVPVRPQVSGRCRVERPRRTLPYRSRTTTAPATAASKHRDHPGATCTARERGACRRRVCLERRALLDRSDCIARATCAPAGIRATHVVRTATLACRSRARTACQS